MKAKSKSKSNSKQVSSHKDTNHKTSNKKKKTKINKAPPEDYIILNGNIYGANTHSERDKYSGFISNSKVAQKFNSSSERHKLKKKSMEKVNCFWQGRQEKEGKCLNRNDKGLNLEEYVRSMSEEEKADLLRKLQKQMKINPQNKWLLQRKNIEQIQSTKLKNFQQKLEKVKSQLMIKWKLQKDFFDVQYKQKQITKEKRKEKAYIIDKMKEQKLKILDCARNLFKKILGSSSSRKNYELEDIFKNINSISSFDNLPLESQSSRHTESQNSIKTDVQFEIDEKEKLKMQIEEGNTLSIDSPQTEKLKCRDEGKVKKFNIPLLATKQKTEEMQNEKKMKEIVMMRQEIDRRMVYQMSQMQEEDPSFTTLAGMNKYIIELYEYIIKYELDKVIERFNIPFGKSVRDKLYSLQYFGEIDQYQIMPVLDDKIYHGFHQQMALNMKRVSEFEKYHQKVVFDCFNMNLNVYRPYYQLQGEVYPWSVSEKGMTFYEINQQNIEEVFEKTKIKVLEFASALCGVMPKVQTLPFTEGILKEKRQEMQGKEEKICSIQQYHKWGIKLVNTETLVRMLISETIFQRQINDVISQVSFMSCLH